MRSMWGVSRAALPVVHSVMGEDGLGRWRGGGLDGPKYCVITYVVEDRLMDLVSALRDARVLEEMVARMTR
jgi:hypothetical protein